ncbi:hypothetical protein A9K72_33670 [Mesorhizobium loti]|nr:hypothetical protein A9174_32930 [Mesorhizobium loti NZP2037]OBP77775.1 hypothetical protein BAE41_31170 [Mesorhizobium loti]OBP96865.1 hypothetical protein BAE38_26545 [Mesorhizobium loti]OBQ69978.1 hypothetical protein A9K72_33670 [Mesorhizobium loti]
MAWEDGRLRQLGRVDMRRDLLEAFAAKLAPSDIVVIEATGNASSAAAVVALHVKKVVIANPKQVRIIAYAKIKTDTIDAGVLAQLYASGFLPEVWIPDEPTQALRRQVTRRQRPVVVGRADRARRRAPRDRSASARVRPVGRRPPGYRARSCPLGVR